MCIVSIRTHIMTSFKQFGGLAYNSKQNITNAAHSVHTDQIITGFEGATNTRTIINSHVDLSGSSIMQVGGIYFADGSVLQTAQTTGSIYNDGVTNNSCVRHTHPIDPTWEHLIGPEGQPGVDGMDGNDGKDGINSSHVTDALENTSVGSDNLLYVTDTAKYNVATGRRVLMKTKTGYANSGFGYETLINNVHGNYNTAVGLQALAYNVTGSHNTAVGAGADVTNPTIVNATAIGAGARVNKSNVIVLGNSYVTDVITSGIITGKAKNFTIEHPLKEMKEQGYVLKHASVEAPRLDLLYRDTVTLVAGCARINIDELFHMTEGTFASLCTNPSIFTTNESDWDPVRGKMEVGTNILHITCKNEQSCANVSFLVIAERKDESMMDAKITDDTGRFIPEHKKD